MNSCLKFLACLLVLSLLPVCISCSTFPEAVSPPAETSPPAADKKTPRSAYYPVEITDFLDYTTTVRAADRIISLTTSSTQILMALGAEAQIVGVDAYSEPFLPGKEIVGDYTGPDIEKIASLEPDLVIAANAVQREAIDQLRSLGIPVIAAEPTAWDQVTQGFEMIGAAVGNRAGADKLKEQLSRTVDTVKENAPAEVISCYYVLSYGSAGNWTSGEGSFINTMMELAGGEPVTKNTASPWLEYPVEDLIRSNPDCIILGSGAGTLEDFVHTSGYEDLQAVQTGHVYEIDSNLVTIPSQVLNEGLLGVSEILGEAAESKQGA